MIRKSFLLLIGVAVFSALLFAACQRTPEQRAEKIVQHLASELNLNAAQTAQMEKIKNEFLDKSASMGKDRDESIKELNLLMTGTDIDRGKLNALVEKHQAAANELIRFVADKFAEIHDMLTPEQRAKLVTMVENHRAHRSERSSADK